MTFEQLGKTDERLEKIEKEMAEIKRQLDMRPERTHPNVKVVLAAEKIIENLKQKQFREDMIRDILAEASHQIK